MTDTPLSGLIIRTAMVRQPGVGYIYAADPRKEGEGIPHAISFKYQNGVFARGDANYDAHALALIASPGPGLVVVSGAGYYSALMATGTSTGDLFDDSQPRPETPRTGGIRSIATIAGKAYAVGLRGIVYRFDGPKQWRRIDGGLADTFDGQAIHGFGETDIYVVGSEGAVWHSEGARWRRCLTPASAILSAVFCAPDDSVYVAGRGGVLLKGRAAAWDVLTQRDMAQDIWDLEWFQGELYVSTLKNVYRLQEDRLVPVDFGDDRPGSCYQLSANGGVLWANGEFDVMSFDGQQWSRIV